MTAAALPGVATSAPRTVADETRAHAATAGAPMTAPTRPDMAAASATPRAPYVELDDVRFSYDGRPVLEGASLEVRAGELVALTGENGAGKSTVARLVLGELSPTAGEVRVLGRRPGPGVDWTRVGYVPQAAASDFKSFPATVLETLAASCTRRRGARERSAVVMAELGISGLARNMLRELSGGQLQRVLLARALVNEPLALVLDEPTSGLDAANAAGFSETMARAVEARGMGVLLVTHDLARIALPARHRVLRVEDGRVSEVEEPCGAMREGI